MALALRDDYQYAIEETHGMELLTLQGVVSRHLRKVLSAKLGDTPILWFTYQIHPSASPPRRQIL